MNLDKLDPTRRIENIELIRDILFGPQLKEYSNRLQTLENAHKALRGETVASIKEVRDELNKRSDDTKQILKEFQLALRALRDDIKANKAAENDENTELRQQLDRLGKRLASNISNLDEALDKQVSSVRDDLLSSHRKQQADLIALRTEVFEELEKRIMTLSSAKVTREDMAESFFELALKLKGSELPAASLPEIQAAPPVRDEPIAPEPVAKPQLAESVQKTKRTKVDLDLGLDGDAE
ncbi:hypothetical protein VB712_06420 [Spirulina sp. CCNP1310]|uniref:hypothetical protein n=1 Tax=Spirulina sp. CCNP1310 TaxID=3110249 RepID=UPI002B2127FD|nr:hypothetical protein [Spirulina sp. CCNP1310]MEA5418856.1 hypothetical protein [Spirulina sp. CCNP1310]